MPPKKSISSVNLFCWITTVIIVGICFIIFFIYHRYNDFLRTERNLKDLQEKMITEFLSEKVSESAFAISEILRTAQKSSGESDSIAIEDIEDIKNKELFQQIPRNQELLKPCHGVIILSADKQIIHPEKEKLPFTLPQSLVDDITQKSMPGKILSGEFYHESENAPHRKDRIKWVAQKGTQIPFVVLAVKNMRSVDTAILSNINRIKIDMKIDIAYIVFLMLVVIGVAIRFAYLIASNIRDEVKSLTDLCSAGIEFHTGKAPEQYQFKEFMTIAKAIRSMSAQISELLNELKNTALSSTLVKQVQSGVLSNITHDLLDNLNAIMGTAQILKEKASADKNDFELKNSVEEIISSAVSINNLLNDVAYISALDTNSFKPVQNRLSIEKLKSDILKNLSISAQESTKRIQWKISETVPKEFLSDKNLLYQIFVNIFETGIRSNNQCECLTDITLSTGQDKQLFIIKFMLKGIGWTKRELDEILKFPFVSQKYSAEALRLAVCRRFVELLNGTITFDILENNDLIASMELPFTELPVSESQLPQTVSASPFSQLKAMVADDDQGSRRVMSVMLNLIGINNIIQAEDGRQVLSNYEKTPDLDIILMDCEMPHLNGFETTCEIRKKEAGTKKHVSIIAVSGYTSPDDKKRCLDSGMDAFLGKPIDLDELREAILNTSKR